MWHGQDDIAGKVLGQLADDFNKTHSDIKVNATTGGVVADQMRQKVTTALASGEYPDIAYIFGSDLANLARSDKVLDLTDDVKKPDFDWDDYYAPAKAATTVDGKVRALPALIDDLAVVYNKKLFKEMGVPEPPDGRLDVGAVRGHLEAAHRQVEGHVRHRVAGGRRRGHRVAHLAARVAGRRRHHHRGRQGRLRRRSPASRRSASSTGSRRTARSTSTPSPTPTRPTSCSTTARSAWSSPGRGSCPTSSTPRSTSASRRCRRSAASR